MGEATPRWFSPGTSYTNNWPPDRSVGNTPSAEALVWSIASILSLFAVLGLVVYVVHRYGFFYGGLFLMFSTGLLPIGLLQVWCSYTKGFWYARSAEFYELPIVQTLGSWLADRRPEIVRARPPSQNPLSLWESP